MDMKFIEEVYYTMLGHMENGFEVPGVENVFSEGKPCLERYSSMLAAYERLCDRLGVKDEDKDVETVINALLENQKELCCLMYQYGAKFGQSAAVK